MPESDEQNRSKLEARVLATRDQRPQAAAADVETHSNQDGRSVVPVDPPLPESLEPGTRIGPYQIVETLGMGGLGRVYRAHDPRLARDLAIKVLHRRYEGGGGESEYHHRLLREGQALAKLSHPNVVAVYDVGTYDSAVFVAMELVQGKSLRAWLDTEHERAEVLRVLIAAGRGLSAAHAAGVTHRDFKPANVMVSPDGRARIVDFGLAGEISSEGAGKPVPPDDDAAPFAYASSFSGSESSRTSGLRGTPGYIAPELLRGESVVDEQADQYSYAVTVFLALTGKKPYPGQTMAEYRAGVARGVRSSEWPTSVPRRIRRVVERGLAERPADRYPSVLALIEALERASVPGHRIAARMALPLAALLIMIAGGWVFTNVRATRVSCNVDATPFAGVWDPERRATLERSLVSVGGPAASDAFARLAARLDAFQTDWLAMRKEACEAALVRGEQPEQVLALRNACLERKLEGVKALVNAFAPAGPRSVERAASATPDSIQECADTAALTGVASTLPEDPEARQAIVAIDSGFAVVRSLLVAGRDAKPLGLELLESARQRGHQRTLAEALTWAARAINGSATGAEDRKWAEALSREGMQLAAQTGDDQLLARTASYLFVIIAWREKRTEEAAAMFPMVDALVSRAGDDPEQRIEVLIGEGAILRQRGNRLEAIRAFEQAASLSAKVTSERKTYGAYARGQIGELYVELHRYPEAVGSLQAEVDGIRKELGERHPRVIFSLTNLGVAQAKAGLRNEAWSTAASLSELIASIVPPGDWRVATIKYLEGNIWEQSGDCARALPPYSEALEHTRNFFGADHVNTADVRERLGSCLDATGQADTAIEQLETTLKIRRSLGAAPNIIAEAAFKLADVLWSKAGSSARPRAITLAEEAQSLWRQDHVTEQVHVAEHWLRTRQPALAAGR